MSYDKREFMFNYGSPKMHHNLLDNEDISDSDAIKIAKTGHKNVLV